MSSLSELRQLMFCMTVVVTFVAYLMYHVETMLSPSETHFDSVVDSIWWAFVTQTTVGYGDFVLLTVFVHFFAALFMTCGAFSVSLFVISAVTKFIWLYEKNIEMCSSGFLD